MIKDMKVYISHEINNPDAWKCICGNTPEADGFDTCLPDGRRIEPEGPWKDHYLCNRCESVINQTTLELAWKRGKAMIVYSDWETRRIYCNACADEPDVDDMYYEVELGPLDAVQCTHCEEIIRVL